MLSINRKQVYRLSEYVGSASGHHHTKHTKRGWIWDSNHNNIDAFITNTKHCIHTALWRKGLWTYKRLVEGFEQFDMQYVWEKMSERVKIEQNGQSTLKEDRGMEPAQSCARWQQVRTSASRVVASHAVVLQSPSSPSFKTGRCDPDDTTKKKMKGEVLDRQQQILFCKSQPVSWKFRPVLVPVLSASANSA